MVHCRAQPPSAEALIAAGPAGLGQSGHLHGGLSTCMGLDLDGGLGRKRRAISGERTLSQVAEVEMSVVCT